MAKQYKVNSEFVSIDEQKGTLYNIGSTDAEVVSETNPTKGEGLVLRSGLVVPFASGVLVRSMDDDDPAIINVVDFKVSGEGGAAENTTATGVKTYASGTAYMKNDLVAYGSNLYLVVKDYTADTVENDLTAGNIVQVDAATAAKLATPRAIALSGDATGSATFDGSGNATIATTLARTVGLTDLCPDGAAAHNCFYRGKSLGSSVTSAQWTAIGSGTFRDLFIGDYWTIGGVNWRIAAFDYWLHCGDTECTTHHVVIVPDTSLANAQMNSTNTTDGGYVGSDFYTGANGNTGKATAVNKINAAFGSAHILSHRELLTNAVTNGKPTRTGWYDSTVELMNESMVYGATFLEPNPNGAAPWNGSDNSTIDKAQLPLFAHDQSHICIRASWWLRGVVSPTLFAKAGGQGYCSCDFAGESVGVRPAFGIKQS